MANRGMTSAMVTALGAQSVDMFSLVEFALDSGSQRMTDAGRDVTFGGNVFSSAGNLLNVPNIRESVELRINRLSIKLSGVAQANISVALSEMYTDRTVSIWRGLFDSSGVVVADPVLVFSGRIDDYDISEDASGGTSTVTWKMSSQWTRFENIVGIRTNIASHQTLFAGDTFFDHASEIARDVPWGRP